MKKCIFLLLFLLSVEAHSQAIEKLYPILKDNLWGYIDKTGKVIIKPQFHSAGKFSEGLAPVRPNGIYGYIDTKGNFVIKPQFDIAESFEDGIAKVYIDAKPYFIDKTGKLLFEHDYEEIDKFKNHTYAIVSTKSGKCGTINRQGKIVVDTLFGGMRDYNYGLLSISSISDIENDNYSSEDGLIDTLGRWVVNFGKYEYIQEFNNGYAIADSSIIDTLGRERINFKNKNYWLACNNINPYKDIIFIRNFQYKNNEEIDYNKKYIGAINLDGEILFSDTNWIDVVSCCKKRIFIKNREEKILMINFKGEVIKQFSLEYNKDGYYDIDDYSTDGIITFGKGNDITFIDSNGKYIPIPNDSIFKIDTNSRFSRIYNDLIYFFDGNRYGYMDKTGKIIFQNDSIKGCNKELNIDYQLRAYNLAPDKSGHYFPPLFPKVNSKFAVKDSADNSNIEKIFIDTYEHPLWKSNNNDIKLIKADIKEIKLFIDTNKSTYWSNTMLPADFLDKYKGMKLTMTNLTADTITFYANTRTLRLYLQAKDKNGEWRNIEYYPDNHGLCLSFYFFPNETWEYPIPKYHGEFKTKLRAELKYDYGDIEIYVHSNEIDGYVNPAQFWNQNEYHSNRLDFNYGE